MIKAKPSSESLAIHTEIVLPNDTNVLGNLMGGRLLHWLDITAAISAHRTGACRAARTTDRQRSRCRKRSREPAHAACATGAAGR